MLVDSHCHLDRIDLTAFGGKLDKALEKAREAGVEQFLCVAIDQENQRDVIEIAETYPDVFASAGIHPLYTEGKKNDQTQNIGSVYMENIDNSAAQTVDVAYLCEQAKHPKVIAIGETGLDYYYAKESAEIQQSLFRTHIRAAIQAQLPLIIHTRDAQEDTLRIMNEENAKQVGGVFHCFTESLEMARAAIDMGFYISFSGIATFKNATEIRQVVAELPLERILIETDSPYLTPVPHRGKANSPMYVSDVARCLAEVCGLSYQSFCQVTSENYYRLFHRES